MDILGLPTNKFNVIVRFAKDIAYILVATISSVSGYGKFSADQRFNVNFTLNRNYTVASKFHFLQTK